MHYIPFIRINTDGLYLNTSGAAIILVFFVGAFLAISLVFYVLQSLGYYTLAKRRGLRHAWLAWISIGKIWFQGSLSDQYQYLVKGRIKSRRKILLILTVIEVILSVITGAMIAAFRYGGLAATALHVGILMLVIAANIALGITLTVLSYMCMYDIFASCDPQNAAVFLVLQCADAHFPVCQPEAGRRYASPDSGQPRTVTGVRRGYREAVSLY